jgi:hypothetical protein
MSTIGGPSRPPPNIRVLDPLEPALGKIVEPRLDPEAVLGKIVEPRLDPEAVLAIDPFEPTVESRLLAECSRRLLLEPSAPDPGSGYIEFLRVPAAVVGFERPGFSGS